ncbi:hypothetical protein CKA27_21265 [Vibrio coralliilyticus]|jgi:hypothetical protein|nr:hypothetical protein CKA27_21265 [Vibrio coralliilyticus]
MLMVTIDATHLRQKLQIHLIATKLRMGLTVIMFQDTIERMELTSEDTDDAENNYKVSKKSLYLRLFD